MCNYHHVKQQAEVLRRALTTLDTNIRIYLDTLETLESSDGSIPSADLLTILHKISAAGSAVEDATILTDSHIEYRAGSY